MQAVRSGAWITPERIRNYSILLLVMCVASIAYLWASANGVMDSQRRPLGTDFSNIYAAGSYVREGDAAAPFDPPKQLARERAIFGEDTPFYGWHYPPFFLGVAALLAGMPYLVALAVWQIATFLFYLRSQWQLLPHRLALLAAAAFPAVYVNATHGHNGFLTAALLGSGLWLLPKRPWLAGIVIGLLAYKPQFAVLVPLALAAGGYWRSFFSAALTVAALMAAVTWWWGAEVWQAFATSAEFTRSVVLEKGETGFYKIQSVFAWQRLWGSSVGYAYVMQGTMALLAAVAVCIGWRRRALAMEWKIALLIFASMLSTPYSLDYDLMVLAPAMALWVRAGLREGFLPYEKTVLALLWLSPLVTRAVAQHALIPLSLWLMIAAFALLVRRVRI